MRVWGSVAAFLEIELNLPGIWLLVVCNIIMGKQSNKQGSDMILLVITQSLRVANIFWRPKMNFQAVGAVAKFKRNSVSLQGGAPGGSLSTEDWIKRSLFSTVELAFNALFVLYLDSS